jgi:predicted amidohydrolase YtcJ
MKTLYRASVVHTQSHPETGEWVLVEGRHVQRVGSGDPPGADRVVELPGATILPGFVDTHVHLTSTGLSFENADVEAARSWEELLDVARAHASTAEGDATDAPLYLQGYDESAWDEPTLPGADQLAAVTDRPLVIRRADGHVCLANERAIDAAGLRGAGGVELDPEGTRTGLVRGDANDRLGRWAVESIDDLALQSLQLRAAGVAAARGVTTVHEMAMPHWHGPRELEVLLDHRRQLPVDVVPVIATTDLPTVIERELTSVGGDMPVDGSIGARTAWLLASYAGSGEAGRPYLGDDELAEFFHGGHVAGLQVGVHAIGDAAIEQVLSVWERVYGALDSRERRHFRARRHRIEHFEMPSPAQIERTAVLGLAVSVQPAFDLRWGSPGGLYDLALGWERAASMNPFRSMLDRGVVVGVGSDAPVTPLDPMLAVHAMEVHHAPQERVSRREAIRLHTIGSARVGHQEEKKGALTPGMHADLAAYEVDPLNVPSVEGLRPVLTVSLGREVFAR